MILAAGGARMALSGVAQWGVSFGMHIGCELSGAARREMGKSNPSSARFAQGGGGRKAVPTPPASPPQRPVRRGAEPSG